SQVWARGSVVPAAGVTAEIRGGVVSGPFETLTVTLAEMARFPAASRAIAVRRCVPAVAVGVSHETSNGAIVSSTSMFRPSSWNCTPATPEASLAVALSHVRADTG